MKMTHNAPAFRYQLRDFLLGFAPFYAVIVAIVAVSLIGSRILGGNINFSGFGICAAICLLVFGIVSPRPNLRLCIQLGVSRRTAFNAQLAAMALSSALLAVAGEVLLAVGQAIGGSGPDFFLQDLYQILYTSENVLTLTLSGHLLSILFNLSLMLALFALGMFLTFVFWRLSKGWTIVAAISIPVLLNGIPLLAYQLSQKFAVVNRLFEAAAALLVSSVWSAVVLCLLTAVFFVLISWLLVRRANIRAPQN